MNDIDKKFLELEEEYFLNNDISVFMDVNRYGKPFLKVNVFLPNSDINETFNWTEQGYTRALDFIRKWEVKVKNANRN